MGKLRTRPLFRGLLLVCPAVLLLAGLFLARLGAAEAPLELLFAYGSEKEDWVKGVTDAFNARKERTAAGQLIVVKGLPTGSGECIDDLVEGRLRAHLASPASGVYVTLGDHRSRKKGDGDLLTPVGGAPGDTKLVRLVRSPVVIALWKPMAEAMGWPEKEIGWKDIHDLVNSPNGWARFGQPDWGQFRFAHTHPLYSNSGLISVLAEVYAAAGKTEGLTPEDVRAAGPYLERLEKGVVHYGSSTGFLGKRMYGNDPTFLNAAVLYENMVVESYLPENRKGKDAIVAVYPKEGTFWSDHPVGLVNRKWVGAGHREAAEKYVRFLMGDKQQESAVAHGFRPGLEKVRVGAPLDKAHGVDPDNEPRSVLKVPPAEVMEEVLALWKAHKKRSWVTLVIDTSGSMNDDDKLQGAKAGAKELLNLLSERDSVSLLTFNSAVTWIEKDPVALTPEGKEKLARRIDRLLARNQTALYDAVALASKHVDEKREADKISAIVVLTDGEDNKSAINFDGLKKAIAFNAETRPTRVFTICYGGKASDPSAEERRLRGLLQAVSEATRAKSYAGDPENVRKVFRDIVTFF